MVPCFLGPAHGVSCWIPLETRAGRCEGALPVVQTRSFLLRRLLGFVLAAVTLLEASECGWGASPQNPPAHALGPPAVTIPRLTRAPALEDFLGMEPAGEIALQMAKVTGFVQRNPHDGEKVSEETAAYLGYDQKNLYIVFVCFDDAKKVRGRMSRREDIFDDDQVEVMLDTFHDRRRAYAFQTTPLGVQWDAIWTEAARVEVNGNFDTSFDTVWNSRGKVTNQGFVVWIAIPFKSLRFPATKQQVWG